MIKRNKSQKLKNKSRKPKNKSRKPKKAKGSSHFISVKRFTRRLRKKSRRIKENRIKKAKKKKEIQAIKDELKKTKKSYPSIDDNEIKIGTMLVTKFNAPIDIILKILKESKKLEEEDKQIRLNKINELNVLLDDLKEENEILLSDLLENLSLPSNIDTMITKLKELKTKLNNNEIDFTNVDDEIKEIEKILDELSNLLDSFLLDEHPNEEIIQQILTKLEQEYD